MICPTCQAASDLWTYTVYVHAEVERKKAWWHINIQSNFKAGCVSQPDQNDEDSHLSVETGLYEYFDLNTFHLEKLVLD